MKSLKIKKVVFDNRRRLLSIETKKGTLSIPYQKLMLKPKLGNQIVNAYPDKNLGFLAVTYTLRDGSEDSVPSDAFLDFNCDPNYIRDIELHKLSIEARTLLVSSGLSKREVTRRLGTSMSQLLRLLDPANSKKTVDQMIRLLAILGARVEIKVA